MRFPEGDTTLLYATDTNVFPEETWQGLRDKQVRCDVVVLDHTYGPDIDGDGHLNANRFIEHVQRMRAEGFLKPDGRVFATHISHEGNPVHAELVEFGERHGYEIAYDGLVVESAGR